MPRAPPVALETANPPPAASNWSQQRPGKAGGTPEPPGSCSLETEGRGRTWAPVALSWSSVQLSVGRLIAASRLDSDGLLVRPTGAPRAAGAYPLCRLLACMPSLLCNLPMAFSPFRTSVPQRRHRRLKSEPGAGAPGEEQDSPPPPWGSTQVPDPSDLSLSPPPPISSRSTGNTCLCWLAPSFCPGASLCVASWRLIP